MWENTAGPATIRVAAMATVSLPKTVTKHGSVALMPTRLCEWCREPVRQSDTGRPRRYCDTRCRVAAFRDRRLVEIYDQPWQRRALAEGWRPPAG
jgi:hypothetical protein